MALKHCLSMGQKLFPGAVGRLTCILVLVLSFPVLAQDVVDISGQWDAGELQTRIIDDVPLSEHGLRISEDYDHSYDPHIQCVQSGLPRLLMIPYPIRIEQFEDRVVITYEEWDVVRTIPVNGHFPEHGGLLHLGHSVANYVGDELVISTIGLQTGIARNRHQLWFTSYEATVEERYAPMGDGTDRLRYRFTLTDPVMLDEPWTVEMHLEPYPEDFVRFDCTMFERPTLN